MEHITRNIYKKILLTGGGTGGSVAPLLAIASQLSIINYQLSITDFLFVGTKFGPEREMVASASLSTGEREGIEFKAISSGKLRRYFSFKNFTDLFLILIGFFQAFFIILKWRPDLIMSAGSFVSVPVVWAGWILGVPILIHQQDVRAGLANKLMAPFAKVITVTFKESLKDYGKKAVWTGNPVRHGLTTINNKQLTFNNLPTVLIIGGGTGAMAINELVWNGLDELTKFCNIIHITGKDKSGSTALKAVEPLASYKHFEFLNSSQMAESYAAADIVVSRAGMGALTELSYLGKSAILIPMSDSHQEENAEIFKEKEAAIVLNQKELTVGNFVDNIKKLLDNGILRQKLSDNMGKVIREGANKKFVEIIKNII